VWTALLQHPQSGAFRESGMLVWRQTRAGFNGTGDTAHKVPHFELKLDVPHRIDYPNLVLKNISLSDAELVLLLPIKCSTILALAELG